MTYLWYLAEDCVNMGSRIDIPKGGVEKDWSRVDKQT